MPYALDRAVKNIFDNRKKNGIKEVLQDAIQRCEENNQSDGRLIFLLDALDETRDARSRVVEEIEDMRNQYEKAFFIVTSRIVNYREIPLTAFSPYLVEELGIDEITKFVKDWFVELARKKTKEEPGTEWDSWATERANFLINQVYKIPGIRHIATSPLYLTFLVLLASNPKATLPQTRADLYREYFDRLLFDWEKKHRPPFSATELSEGFREISWIIHRSLYGNIKKTPTRDFVNNAITLSFTTNTAKVLDICIRAGIFIVVKDENQNEIILPRHLSFLEYGFARKLAYLWDNQEKSEDVWKDLEPNLHNTHLYEPLLLFVGSLEGPIDFLSKVLELTKEDDLFHSNLIFLSKAVNEVKHKLENKEIIQKLLSRLLDVWGNPNDFLEPIKINLLNCIGLIGGVQHLAIMFKDEADCSTRKEIVDLIVNIEGKAAIPLLEEFFYQESEFSLRRSIVEYISRLANKTLFISFIRMLFEKEPDANVRGELANSIGILVDETTMPLLKELYEKEPDANVRVEFANSIGILVDETTMPILKELYEKEPDANVRGELAFSIGLWADETTMPILKELYEKEPDANVRGELAGYFGEEEYKKLTFPILKELYEKEPDANVKGELAFSISKAGNKNHAISLIKELFEKEPELKDKGKFIDHLHWITQKERILIFEDKKGHWKPVEIPARYTF